MERKPPTLSPKDKKERRGESKIHGCKFGKTPLESRERETHTTHISAAYAKSLFLTGAAGIRLPFTLGLTHCFTTTLSSIPFNNGLLSGPMVPYPAIPSDGLVAYVAMVRSNRIFVPAGSTGRSHVGGRPPLGHTFAMPKFGILMLWRIEREMPSGVVIVRGLETGVRGAGGRAAVERVSKEEKKRRRRLEGT